LKKENMRVTVSKRMLKEGILRLLEKKSISKISITCLCEEAGVNRATFYRYYQIPEDVLQDIAWDYINKIGEVYNQGTKISTKKRIISLFEYLLENKKNMKVLFSANADQAIANSMTSLFAYAWDNYFGLKSQLKYNDPVEYQLAVTGFGWGMYYVVRQWILDDIDRSPEEMADFILKIL